MAGTRMPPKVLASANVAPQAMRRFGSTGRATHSARGARCSRVPTSDLYRMNLHNNKIASGSLCHRALEQTEGKQPDPC